MGFDEKAVHVRALVGRPGIFRLQNVDCGMRNLRLRGQAETFNKLRLIDDHIEDGFEAARDSRADGIADEV